MTQTRMPQQVQRGANFSLVLPPVMRRQLFAAARLHDRSSGAEMREALRRYFAELELDDDGQDGADGAERELELRAEVEELERQRDALRRAIVSDTPAGKLAGVGAGGDGAAR